MDKFHSDVCDTFFDTDRIEFIDIERSKEAFEAPGDPSIEYTYGEYGIRKQKTVH